MIKTKNNVHTEIYGSELSSSKSIACSITHSKLDLKL